MNETFSKDFQTFLNDYFTGHPMIRSRGEEDVSVWDRLKGEELEIAKQKILDELPSEQEYLMRAVAKFKDERAIPKLIWTAENGISEHSRCYAAKVLYDWIGYDKYFEKLDDVYKSGSQYSKTSLIFWIYSLDEKHAHKYFWIAMNDPDSYVRFSALRDLEIYYGLWEIGKDTSEIRYFTDEEVYRNPKIFQKRKEELRERISKWKKN